MESRVLPPSTAELNLLLEWPDQRTSPQWAAILATSIVLHLIFFFSAAKVPSLIGQRVPEPQRVVKRIPLYFRPDVMTQRAPNKAKVSKEIDLADLQPAKPANGSAARRPSVRQFEVPRQRPTQQVARNAPPQIVPAPPAIKVAQNAAPNLGNPGGLPTPAPLPPTQSAGPFQNIGSEDVPLNPHPRLAPPKANVDTAIRGLEQEHNGKNLVISDDVPDRLKPGIPGLNGQAPAQHAAVELQSDANGADFKEYLRTILGIVRTNWRRVVPESARMGALRGKTVVEFIISRDGSIPKLVLADPSGSDPLDRAAVVGLSMSNPLPPLPAGFKGYQVRLAFTFAYNMPSQ